MVSETTHIDGRVFELVVRKFPNVVGVWVDLQVGISDHSEFFIDVVLEQPIPHLVCRQEVYLKNSVD